MRILAWGLASLILVLVAALAAILSLDFGFIRPSLERELTERLGRPVRVEQLELRLGQELRLEARGIRIDNSEWGQAAQLLTVDHLRVRSNTQNLLFAASRRIDEVDISGLRLELERRDTGEDNWTFTFDAEPEDEASASAQRPSIPIWLSQLELRDVHINLRDPKQARMRTLALERLGAHSADAVAVSLMGSLDEYALNFELNAQPLTGLLQLQDTTFTLKGSLDEVSLDASATIADLIAPRRPSVDVRLIGPSLEYLTERLGIPTLSTGPLDARISVAPQGSQMAVDIRGAFGEFLAAANGDFDDLRSLEQGKLNVSVSGPNLRQLQPLMPDTRLPSAPFSLNAQAQRAGSALQIEQSRLTLGRVQLDASGEIPDLNDPASTNLDVSLTIPALDSFATSLDIPGRLSGQANAEFHIDSAPGAATLSGAIRSDYGVINLSGDLTRDGNDIRASLNCDVSNLRQQLAPLLSPDISARLPDSELQVVSELRLSEQTLRLPSVEWQLAGATGTVSLSQQRQSGDLEATWQLASERPANWLDPRWLPDAVADQALEQPLKAEGSLSLRGDTVQLDLASLSLGTTQVSGTILSNQGTGQNAVQLNLRSPNIFVFAQHPPELHGLSTLPVTGSVDLSVHEDFVDIRMLNIDSPDSAVLRAQGRIRFGDTFAGTKLDAELDIASLQRLSPLVGEALPDQPLRARAKLAGDAQHIDSEEFTIQTGQSVVDGMLTISNPDHPQIVFTARSQEIDLRPFLPERSNDSTSTNPTPAANDAASTAASASPSADRLIPDIALDFSALNRFDADIKIDIDRLVGRTRQFSDVQLYAEVKNGALNLSKASLSDEASGGLSLSGFARPSDGGTRIALEANGTDINLGLPATTAEEAEALPRLNIAGVVFGEGTTLRGFLGTANGFIDVAGGSGQIPQIQGSFLTNDFIHELLSLLNPLKKAEPYTQVECSALTAMLKDGKLGGNPFFTLATEKLNVNARAEVNLATEKLFATFNTVPQKGLGISASKALNPFVAVGGTLAKPSLSLDPQGTLVQGGLAIATGGMSLLAKSMADRLFASDEPCREAAKSLSESKKAMRQRYQAFQ